MAQIPRVALLVETSRGYGRAFLRGVVRYARLHGPWEFYITPGDFEQSLPDMSHWGGTGIIARIETPKVAKQIIDSKLPVIVLDVTQNMPIEGLSDHFHNEVASDSDAAARMAADHLLSRGLKHFGFVGEPLRVWSMKRQESFLRRLREEGFEPAIYDPPKLKRDRTWARELPELVDWICSLPTPVGIMACNDERGRQVLEACRAARVNVPVEALVIGVDNDELLCELSPPPLSSVALNAEDGGFRSAELLDRLMQGEQLPPQQLLVEPLHVVERRSTETTFAVRDQDVATALDFIHTHAADPITIDDVVSRLNISRRMFEIRFREAVGHTPHQELRRVRLVRARSLLIETDFPIAKIAHAAGFCSPAHLTQSFKKEFGSTPAHFRRAHQKLP